MRISFVPNTQASWHHCGNQLERSRNHMQHGTRVTRILMSLAERARPRKHLRTSAQARCMLSQACQLGLLQPLYQAHLPSNPPDVHGPLFYQGLEESHHIQHLTFTFVHSEGTFLPPLVHPVTGDEVSFLYTPYIHVAFPMSRPKYENSDLGDSLTQQYPPSPIPLCHQCAVLHQRLQAPAQHALSDNLLSW